MNYTEILTFLAERRLVEDCIRWCATQGPQYGEIHRNILYRGASRDRKKEPYTSRQRFMKSVIEKYVQMKMGESKAA